MFTSRKLRILAPVIALLGSLVAVALMGARPWQTDPLHAPYIDNLPHAIEANSDTWFRFDYGLDGSFRTPVSLTMVNGAHSRVAFEVWAPEIIENWWERQPTGRGTIADLDCETGLPAEGGQCPSPDLTWVGAFGSAGTYYVRILNDNFSSTFYLLTIQGTGVSLVPPTASVPDQASAIAGLPIEPSPTAFVPLAPPVPLAIPQPRDDPAFAARVDGQWHTLPANSATWYLFDYGGGGRPPRTIVGLRLINGVQTRVRFEVWAPENVNAWWEQKPVGRGTQEVVVNCFATAPQATETPTGNEPTPTPMPTATPTGKCFTNDLTWSGAFGAPGTYYVRVVNDNSLPMDYVLRMQ